MALFNAQTAKLAGKLSGTVRRANRNGNGNERTEKAIDVQNREELAIVNKQIRRTCETLDDRTPACDHCKRPALEPHHRAQLLRALDGLLERRRKLTGRFAPGTMRPQDSPKDKRQAPPSFQMPAGEIPESDPGELLGQPQENPGGAPSETPGLV